MNTICKIVFSALWLSPVVILVYAVTKATNTSPNTVTTLSIGVASIIATAVSAMRVDEIWSGRKQDDS